MKESLVWEIQGELTWEEKRANDDIFCSAAEILLDALKEGVIVAVLGLNNERL